MCHRGKFSELRDACFPRAGRKDESGTLEELLGAGVFSSASGEPESWPVAGTPRTID